PWKQECCAGSGALKFHLFAIYTSDIPKTPRTSTAPPIADNTAILARSRRARTAIQYLQEASKTFFSGDVTVKTSLKYDHVTYGGENIPWTDTVKYLGDKGKYIISKKKKEVIENKATSANAIKRRVKAWDDVCNEFNSSSGESIRTVKQLKILYDNMKRRARKEFSKRATEKYDLQLIIHFPLNDIDIAINSINLDLESIFKVSRAHGLILNEAKTDLIVVAGQKKEVVRDPSFKIVLNGVIVTPSQCTKKLSTQAKAYDFKDFVDAIKKANSGKYKVKQMNSNDFLQWPDCSSLYKINRIKSRPLLRMVHMLKAEKGNQVLKVLLGISVCHNPAVVFQKEFKKNKRRGQYEYALDREDGIIVVQWLDNAPVSAASTSHEFYQFHRRGIVQIYLTRYGVAPRGPGRQSTSRQVSALHRISDDVRYDAVCITYLFLILTKEDAQEKAVRPL
ncbi:hypothetical protein NQ317_016333, partial [Molorchus minor]